MLWGSSIWEVVKDFYWYFHLQIEQGKMIKRCVCLLFCLFALFFVGMPTCWKYSTCCVQIFNNMRVDVSRIICQSIAAWAYCWLLWEMRATMGCRNNVTLKLFEQLINNGLRHVKLIFMLHVSHVFKEI